MEQETIKKIGEKGTEREIVEISRLTSNLVRDALGPVGLWSMIIDEHGLINWVKSGGIILSKIAPKRGKLEEPMQAASSDKSKSKMMHPIAMTMGDAAKNVTEAVGDGSKRVIILAGEIMRKEVESRIHKAIFINGCINAMKKCLETIRKISIPFSMDSPNSLRRIIRTFLNTRFELIESTTLTGIVFEAVRKTMRKSDSGEYRFNSDEICERRESGGTILDTRLIDGVALFKEIPNFNMPRRVENAKVALISGGVNLRFSKQDAKLRTRYYEHKIIFESPEDIQTFRNERTKISIALVDKLASLGVGAIIIEKGLNPEIEELLTNKGILAIRRVHMKDLEKIARMIGANVVSDIEFLSPKDLGYAKLIEEGKIGDHPWIFIKGCECNTVTILIRGIANAMIDESKNSIHDCLNMIERLFLEPRILPGGGASEAEMANRLRKEAGHISGREQLVIRGVAEVLETIPVILAESCGLDPIDSIVELRARHSKGETYAGIDVFKRKVTNVLKAGIYEPALVYDQIIKSSFEIAVHLLRIDDFIASKVRYGNEYWKRRIEEFTEPKREKQIIREYGIDR